MVKAAESVTVPKGQRIYGISGKLYRSGVKIPAADCPAGIAKKIAKSKKSDKAD